MNIENLDDIKSSWQQANAPLSSMAGETLRESRKALLRRGSAQDKLAAQYRRMACAAAAGLAVWLFAVLTMLDFVAWARPWLAVATVVFFVTSGVMDLWLCRAVRRIDLAAWPVSAVALEGRRLLRVHKIFILVLLPMAFGLLFFMVWALDVPPREREGIMWGMAAGGAAGIAIGVCILVRFLRLSRTLTDDLG